MKSVWSDETGRIINKVNNISCCVPLTSLYLKKLFKKNITLLTVICKWKQQLCYTAKRWSCVCSIWIHSTRAAVERSMSLVLAWLLAPNALCGFASKGQPFIREVQFKTWMLNDKLECWMLKLECWMSELRCLIVKLQCRISSSNVEL